MYQQPKSATTAGLLGIFLGSVGAHNWYLGEKNKGIIHVCLAGAGIIMTIAANIIGGNLYSLVSSFGLVSALTGIGGLLISASGIWGLVEGIIILSQGDAGLAAKGYSVATTPAQGMPMNGMGMNNMSNMNNMPPQMNNMNGMNNGMPMNGSMNNMSNDMGTMGQGMNGNINPMDGTMQPNMNSDQQNQMGNNGANNNSFNGGM